MDLEQKRNTFVETEFPFRPSTIGGPPKENRPAPTASRLSEVVQPRLQVLVDAIPRRRQGGRPPAVVIVRACPSAAAGPPC